MSATIVARISRPNDEPPPKLCPRCGLGLAGIWRLCPKHDWQSQYQCNQIDPEPAPPISKRGFGQ